MQHLLSSSMDKTVRLWRADSDECLAVFHHSNYGKDSFLTANVPDFEKGSFCEVIV